MPIGPAIGIGLTILSRLLEAYKAGNAEDRARQLTELYNTRAGTPSANSYNFSEGQDITPEPYTPPNTGVPLPPRSSFLERLLDPSGEVQDAGIYAAIAKERAKTHQETAAKLLQDRLEFQRQLGLAAYNKQTPQALNPLEEEVKRATAENLRTRTAQQPYYGQAAQAKANYFNSLLNLAGMAGGGMPAPTPENAPTLPPTPSPAPTGTGGETIPLGPLSPDVRPFTAGERSLATPPAWLQNAPQGSIGTAMRGQPGLLPPRVPVVKGFGPTGPTIGMEVPPDVQARIDAEKAAQQAQATEAAKALPGETTAKMAEFESVERNARDIRQMIVEHPEFLGVERSWTVGAREAIGHDTISPQESVFNGKINLIYAQLVRALQGARASDEDIKNFGYRIFPSASIRDPEVFLARVDNAIDYVKNYSARYKELATTPRGQLRNQSASPRSAPSGGTTWRWSGGKLVPQEQ